MTSLQSQLIYIAMKNRHLLEFRLKPETWDFTTSVQGFRERCERGAKRMAKLPQGIQVQPLTVAGMPAEWLIPDGAPADKKILYTHGGGYISGSLSDHRAIVAKMAKACGVSILLFEYRLAPEHPYPAALEDALAAYTWLLDQGTVPQDIMVVGESAGGGLCLALLITLKERGLALPAGGVAISPVTDQTLSGESQRTNARVCLSPPGMAEVCAAYYAGDQDRSTPGMSPLFGDLAGLPPLLIYVGGYETLLDDSTRFAAKAQQAGVDVTLRVGEKMIHCYPLLAPAFPEATAAIGEICQYIRRHLAFA